MRPVNAWEFRFRFWTIAVVFWAGFQSYAIDHVNAVVRVVGWMNLPADERRVAMHVAFGVAAALTLAAALVRTWAAAYLRTEVVHDGALRSERLVADGPFRYVRNPLYLGSLLLAAGLGLMASGLGWVVIVLGMGFITSRLIAREEAALLASQGPDYRRYLDAVPRLVPSLRPRVPSGGHAAHWGQAFLGEAPMWAFAAGAAAMAVTLEARQAMRVIFAAFILYIVQWAVFRGRAFAQGSGLPTKR